jgi:endonuclease-3
MIVARRFASNVAVNKKKALAILDRLDAEYPNAKCALDFKTPLDLLIATILAAQARDSHINTITAKLFPKYRTAREWATADEAVLLEELRPTGFFNSKTKSVLGATRAIVERFGGEVPEDMDALTSLPGVGRKTANVVLGNAFGHPDRVAVDTHVKRLSERLGFTKSQDPDQIEKDLVALWPAERRTHLCHVLQFHGRRICPNSRPKCDACVVNDLCPSAFTFEKTKKTAAGKKRPTARAKTTRPKKR